MTPEIPDYLRTSTPRGGENIEPYDLPALDKYRDSLRNMPASGGGGCHTALLSIANLGRAARLSPAQIAHDLATHVHGTRIVTRKEIEEAVKRAFASPVALVARRRPEIDGKKLLASILERGAGATSVDLWEASPVSIDWAPERDAIEVLEHLYADDERLFIGGRFDSGPGNILPVGKWIGRFEHEGYIPEHIIPNPLTGVLGWAKDGKPSYRSDDCVERFAFAVIEFDQMPKEDQIHFWAGVKLPVAALIDSAGKSIHAWVKIDALDAAEWTERVEGKLFDILRSVGADGSCRNESRLSRMPGHFRAEKNKMQRVLYLNPTGGAIIR